VDTQASRSDSRFPFGIKILDRYVAREFLVGYAVSVLVVLALRVLMDLFLQFDEFMEAQGGAWAVFAVIVDYYGPKLFEYFRDFSGTMIILAAAFSLSRLTRQNELTAVLASGVSLKRVIAPIVLLSFGLNMIMVADQEIMLPRLAGKLVRKHDEIQKLDTIPIWLLPDRGGSLVCSPEFNPDTKEMTDLTVILREQGRVTGRIVASKARWNAEKKGWDLTGGAYYPVEETADSARQAGEIAFYESALSADYLWLQRNRQAKSLMSSSDLTRMLRQEQGMLKPVDRKETISEKHFRFTDPIINMVMLMTGLPLLVSRERRNTRTAIALTLLGSGGCFVATFACKLMAGGSIPPLIAAWLPIIVFLPVSVLTLDSLKT